MRDEITININNSSQKDLFETLSNSVLKVPVKVKKLSDHSFSIDVKLPEYKIDGDSGFDLVAAETVVIRPGETVAVPTRLAFAIPKGFEIQIRPRSGLSLKTKFRVILGTVDSNYRGEVKVICENNNFPAYKINQVNNELVLDIVEDFKVIDLNNNIIDHHEKVPVGTIIVKEGDRIAQGVINQVGKAIFILTEELPESHRGKGGFGSTGVSTP